MRRLSGLLLLLLLCGCAAEPRTALPAIATPGPAQQTQIQGIFRGEGEPAEVVELDSEHGYWSYRTDTLGMAIEFREDDFSGGTVSWCFAEIAWRDEDPLRVPEGLERGLPAELAVAAQGVLFMPETERLTLVENGEMRTAGGACAQRAGYGRLPDGGYIAIAVSGRYQGESVGLSAEELAGLFLEAGCEQAVQLAEGPAAAIVFMGRALNDPFDGNEAAADGGVAWGRTDY